MTGILSACDICQLTGTGTCINNRTCQCYGGHIGISCQDPVTTPSPTQVSISSIVAGVLGGALFMLVVGLVVFFIWRRRSKRKGFFKPSTTPPSEPVVVPALYNLSLSRQDSSGTSAQTMSYHLYDELP